MILTTLNFSHWDYLECIKTKGQGTNYGVDIPPTQYMNIF